MLGAGAWLVGSPAALLLSLEAPQGERWFVVGSGLAFLGLLGVAFYLAAVRPSAIYPSPFWPRARIDQFFAENTTDVRGLGAVQALIAVSLLSFGTSLTGRPTFELPEGSMDVGMGVHGEAGLSRRTLASADEVAVELLALLLTELEPTEGAPVWALVNTLGATPVMEGLVVLRRVTHRLAERRIPLHRARVGEYVTSLEMAGLSLTITVLDEELRRLLDAPGRSLAAPSLDEPW